MFFLRKRSTSVGKFWERLILVYFVIQGILLVIPDHELNMPIIHSWFLQILLIMNILVVMGIILKRRWAVHIVLASEGWGVYKSLHRIYFALHAPHALHPSSIVIEAFRIIFFITIIILSYIYLPQREASNRRSRTWSDQAK